MNKLTASQWRTLISAIAMLVGILSNKSQAEIFHGNLQTFIEAFLVILGAVGMISNEAVTAKHLKPIKKNDPNSK